MVEENTVGSEPPSADTPPYEPRRRYPLHVKILAGLAMGALLGLLANGLGSGPLSTVAQKIWPHEPATVRAWIDFLAMDVADPLGRIFLRLVLMVVVPLVFSALTLGVLELGDVRRLGASARRRCCSPCCFR